MSFPRARALRAVQDVLRSSRTGVSQPIQRRYAGGAGTETGRKSFRSLTLPETFIAIAVTIPIGLYLLGPQPTDARSDHPKTSIESHLSSPTPRKEEEDTSAWDNMQQDAGRFRSGQSSSEVRRGKKESSAGRELGLTEDGGPSKPLTAAKHSIAINQDSSKSRKSTGEPETAKASGTVRPGQK